MIEDACRLTASEARARMQAGKLTAGELVQSCLDRIDHREDRIGAWVEIGYEQVQRDAAAADRSGLKGPLGGIPVGIKDVIDAVPFHTRMGSPIFRDNKPDADAACVTLLRKAGALIMGKPETTEFASFHPSRTRNPVNPSHTPGGSSAGSAAAVADFHVPIALGTQTAASTSRPAAFCGTYAWKPTIGMVSTDGLLHTSHTLDTIGVFARCVADLGLVHEAFYGAPPAPPGAAPRLGLWVGPGREVWDERVRTFLDRVGKRLRDKGLLAGEIELGADFERGIEHQKVIYAYEIAKLLSPLVAGHEAQVSQVMTNFLVEGRNTPDADYQAALAGRTALQKAFPQRLGNLDALIVAGAPMPAPHGFASTGDPTCGRLWTLLGVPTISIPAGKVANGLPLGIQVVGRAGQDAALFGVAQQVADAVGLITV